MVAVDEEIPMSRKPTAKELTEQLLAAQRAGDTEGMRRLRAEHSDQIRDVLRTIVSEISRRAEQS